VVLLPAEHSIIVWLLFAFSYNVVTLSYALVARGIPSAFVGRSNTTMNTIVILTTFLIQFGFGLLLDQAAFFVGSANQAILYKVGLLVLICLQVVALGWLYAVKKRMA
jgi:hypothetical protein